MVNTINNYEDIDEKTNESYEEITLNLEVKEETPIYKEVIKEEKEKYQ